MNRREFLRNLAMAGMLAPLPALATRVSAGEDIPDEELPPEVAAAAERAVLGEFDDAAEFLREYTRRTRAGTVYQALDLMEMRHELRCLGWKR